MEMIQTMVDQADLDFNHRIDYFGIFLFDCPLRQSYLTLLSEFAKILSQPSFKNAEK